MQDPWVSRGKGGGEQGMEQQQGWAGAAAAGLECRNPRGAELKLCLAAGCDFVRISECRVLHTNPDWQLELGGFQHGVADFSGVKQCPSVSGLPLQSQ